MATREDMPERCSASRQRLLMPFWFSLSPADKGPARIHGRPSVRLFGRGEPRPPTSPCLRKRQPHLYGGIPETSRSARDLPEPAG